VQGGREDGPRAQGPLRDLVAGEPIVRAAERERSRAVSFLE
jgi:hypothetical protein